MPKMIIPLSSAAFAICLWSSLNGTANSALIAGSSEGQMVSESAINLPPPVHLFFVFDEFGNGIINLNSTGNQFNMGQLLPDPTNSNILALTYFLPEIVVNGDVRIYGNLEPLQGDNPEANATLLISDGLRFTDAQGHLVGATADRMIFYSDPGFDNLADNRGDRTPLFDPSFGTGPQSPPPVFEVGPNGSMLDIETSSSFEFFSGNNEYRGISDGMLMLIPEPSTIGLLGVGLLGMGLVRRKFSSFSCRSVRPSHLLLKRSRNKREQ